jgi:hypothetical protein
MATGSVFHTDSITSVLILMRVMTCRIFTRLTCVWIHPASDRVLSASTHHDPEARTKLQAELDFRVSGQRGRYSWATMKGLSG